MTNEPAASGHTPEPWNAPGRVVRASDCFNFVQITVEDYKRACVCVDACTGLSDPAAEIARLRADALRYRWMRDSTDCSLSLTHNDHHLSYVPVDEELDRDYYDEVAPEQRASMVAADSVWTLHIYPNTPVGFNSYSHATLDAAIDAAMKEQP